MSFNKSIVPSRESVMSLSEFQSFDSKLNSIEELKSFGLSDQQISLYSDYMEGVNIVVNKNKNIESQALAEQIKVILETINRGKRAPENKKNITNYSMEPNASCSKKRSNSLPAEHPMNHINEMEADLFGHLDMKGIPSATKRRKILRRMTRKLEKTPEIPEPCQTIKHTEQNTHNYNDFMLSRSQNTDKHLDNEVFPCRNPNSKWDVRECSVNHVIQYEKQIIKPCESSSKRVIGCNSGALYTIRDNKIVRLETRQSDKDDGTSVSEYEEGSTLSIDEIKNIPRFQNYDPGTCTKVLYVKNLAKSIKQEDLCRLFLPYEEDADIALLSGRMRGQAFITFSSEDVANKCLSELNGRVLKGKPMVIEFGKGR